MKRGERSAILPGAPKDRLISEWRDHELLAYLPLCGYDKTQLTPAEIRRAMSEERITG